MQCYTMISYEGKCAVFYPKFMVYSFFDCHVRYVNSPYMDMFLSAYYINFLSGTKASYRLHIPRMMRHEEVY